MWVCLIIWRFLYCWHMIGKIILSPYWRACFQSKYLVAENHKPVPVPYDVEGSWENLNTGVSWNMGGYKEHSSEHRVERAVEKDRNAGTFEGMGVLYTPHKKFSYTFIVGDLKNYSATNSCFINGLHTLHEFIPTFLKKNIHIQQAIKF